MDVYNSPDLMISRIAAAIGEPARVRILYSLLDGHARTSTELSVVAEVTPSTTSVHLNRLKDERLVRMHVQGKHRYYSLDGPRVADALEALSVVAGGASKKFVPNTPGRLRAARTCYDHMAGTLGVVLHNHFQVSGWLLSASSGNDNAYELSTDGIKGFETLGIDLDAARSNRRRFAYACLDWSERQPHIGGALGAALLDAALRRKWVTQDLDSRSLTVTNAGRRDIFARFKVQV